MFFKKGLILWANCLVILLLFSESLYFNSKNNLWSLNFLHSKVEEKPISLFLPQQHPRASLWLAWVALSNGDPNYALELVAPLVDVMNQEALLLAAKAFSANGDFSSSVWAWKHAEDFNSLLLIAQTAQSKGDNENALRAYRAAYEVDMERGVLPLSNFIDEVYKNQIEAEIKLRHALDNYPHSDKRVAWLRKLAYLLFVREQWDGADKILQEVIQEAPNNWWAYDQLGWISYYRGDGVDVAMTYFNKAVDLAPLQGEIYLSVGRVLTNDGRYLKAEHWYSQATILDPGEKKWWELRLKNAQMVGDLQLSVDVLNQMVRIFPDWASAYYALAQDYQSIDHQQDAVEAIEQALFLMSPENTNYYIRAGQIYEWVGENEKAVNAYENALMIDPDNKTAQQGLQRVVKRDLP